MKTFVFVCLALLSAGAVAQDATLVAPTDALSPQEQRALFHLPPGFVIQLVASEPEIGQPMNLQFDAAGRLWVTNSLEYPYPAEGPGVQPRDENFAGADPPHPPRDRVTVFTGIGSDGTPAEVQQFATGLNIPIGQLPVPGGALVYSIPMLERFDDADGDGIAEQHTPFVTGQGNVDTHGMMNGLRRWIDGHIYACHGFRNTSQLRGTDGSSLKLNSGNTFRFNLDGSQLEHYTHGQVNPFGMTFDPLGNVFTADCHSKPLTCLLRGAYYSSFGKPHDGLGFGPDMIDHSHGSTGICGPAYYAAAQFPAEYHECMFLCNPVTGRVHRDRLRWEGSSPHVETQPDFITCDDGWFRPVDLTLGPDGALYLADFYNAIIGHYEVPLGHPKRDRSRGRVWRIVYVGEGDGHAAPQPTPPNLTALPATELVQRLGDPNLTVRVLASHALVDWHAEEAAPLLAAVLATVVDSDSAASDSDSTASDSDSAAVAETASDVQRTHAMWVFERLGQLGDEQLDELSHDSNRLIRTHVARLLAERSPWQTLEREAALRLLTDDDATVRRCAADALGLHPQPDALRPLLDVFTQTPEADTHLRHTLRLALRNVLTAIKPPATVPLADAAAADVRVLAGVLPAVKTAGGAALLGQIVERDLHSADGLLPAAARPAAVEHIAQFGSQQARQSLIQTVRAALADDYRAQAALLEAMRLGLTRRNADPAAQLGAWGHDLALSALSQTDNRLGWTAVPLGSAPNAAATFSVQRRECADGETAFFWSSLPGGETQTGRLRSEAFAVPAALSFWLAGHAGVPTEPPHARNQIRLRDATSGAVLREAAAPRADIARQVEWNLADVAGRRGYLEVLDDDAASAYAWLAVGRFSLNTLDPTEDAGPQWAAALVASLKLTDLAPQLRDLLAGSASAASRAAAAEALLALEPDSRLAALVPLIGDPAVPHGLQDQIVAAVLHREAAATETAVVAAMRTLPAAAQGPLAERLAADPAGAATLLDLAERGHAAPRLLTRPAVKERLAAGRDAALGERLARLVAGLPAEDVALHALMQTRQQTFSAEAADAERGFTLFTKNCAICHRIGAAGSLVGPQLDGIGVRGLDRLTEDILEPNRNVDGAFRSTTIVLADGRVVTGLVRREEGAALILADAAGKEFRVPTADIEERLLSPLSLMPANFAETLPEADYRDLLAYLLAQREPLQP